MLTWFKTPVCDVASAIVHAVEQTQDGAAVRHVHIRFTAQDDQCKVTAAFIEHSAGVPSRFRMVIGDKARDEATLLRTALEIVAETLPRAEVSL